MVEEVGRITRFVFNGILATSVHYAILVALIEGVGLGSVGLATAIASTCGITVSYLGNHYFVLRADIAHRKAVPRFLVCYAVVNVLQTAMMTIWSDWGGLSYSLGFVLFAPINAMLTYLMNRFYVFRNRVPSLLAE